MYLKLSPPLGDHEIQRQEKKEYSNGSQGRWPKKLPGEKRKEELLVILEITVFHSPPLTFPLI